MTLFEAITLARETNDTFKKKFDYWVVKRNKQPEQYWLKQQLELALGKAKCKEIKPKGDK